MEELVKTMKLYLDTTPEQEALFNELTRRYSAACNEVSEYVFDNGFPLDSNAIHEVLYKRIRSVYDLKSQMACSVFKTVTARYKTLQTQLKEHPFTYKDGKYTREIPKTLEWLWEPVHFRRPQADLVRNRDYSFVNDKRRLSINTLSKRVRCSFAVPECFEDYFDGTWKFGTGKLVQLKGRWYLHIPMTKAVETTTSYSHVVGIDRGIRFLAVTYDERGKTAFYSGKEVQRKREKYQQVRSELQSKHTRSAKRALKRISGRENRWMADVNHRLSKTLVNEYGKGTLFVLENLKGVSFDEDNLSDRSKKGRKDLRSWPFFQLEQFLVYKAEENASEVVKVNPEYTSQRCPKCGRIRKENRYHLSHEYVCDRCGYRSNDDRIAAMNIYGLGTLYVSGDRNPRYGARKKE